MVSPTLDDRSQDVLRALVQLHVATGEPVGSESLSKLLSRSSATLRNTMADLERMGYLHHPHTSAGRVPTDEGYRVYVDSLMSHRPLAAREAAAIMSELRPRGDGSASQVLEQASQVLSRLSGNVGFVLGPEVSRTSFRHVDFVRLSPPRILVVLVPDNGLVTHRVIEVTEELSPEDLQACANYLNTHFAGLTLPAIRNQLVELMGREKALYDALLKKVVALGERAFAIADEPTSVYLDGASNMLAQPEFEDIDRMRALFKTFEQKSRLVKILNACLSGQGVRIVIGHENPDPDLRNLALVAISTVEGAGGLSVGVMGSTRMEYARMVALVDHVARSVSAALQEFRA